MPAPPTKYDDLVSAVLGLVRAERASVKASEARAALPPGSTRARVTSANARWSRAAEHRDWCQERVREALAECPELLPGEED